MLIDEFSSFENKYLFEKKYDDFSYWVYSRYAIFSYLTKLQEEIEMSSQKMTDRKSTRLNSSHTDSSRMPSSA